jgi:hypothetical protein
VLVAVAVALAFGVGCNDADEPAGAVLAAADLGADFEDVAFDADRGTGCVLGQGAEPVSSLTAAAVSNVRQQLVSQEVLTFESAGDAEDAFVRTRNGASCPAAGNAVQGGAAARSTEVEGAEDAFVVEYVDGSTAFAFVVVRVARHVAIVSVELHQGAASGEVLGSDVIAASLVERLRVPADGDG